MQKEIEAKFLQIDIDNIRKKLKKQNAVLEIPMRLMRRVMIKTKEMYEDNSFLRIRDEGNKITMTYKQFEAKNINGCNELEIDVSDFDKTVAMLKLLDLNPITYQESKRETWILNECEIVIDQWPWVKPYIEIEGENEKLIRNVAEMLDLNWDDAVFGSVMRAYEAEYPAVVKNNILLSDIKEVKFNHDVPSLLKLNK